MLVTEEAVTEVVEGMGTPAESWPDAGGLRRRNPRDQGLLGLVDAIAWFGARGYVVSVPLVDAQPYDLVADAGNDLTRVQVKTTTHRSRSGVFVVQLATRGGNQSFHTSKPFDPSSCDVLYILTDAAERYVIPADAVASTTKLSLGPRYAAHRVA